MGKVLWRHAVLLLLISFADEITARTLEFLTTQVTAANVAVSPMGGRWYLRCWVTFSAYQRREEPPSS
jgi:hypothetical protein